MERMHLFTKLSVVVFICNLPILCYSNNSNDFLDNLPENTIISLGISYPDYTQVILELPDGKSDTIWIESNSYIYTNNEPENRREKIYTNTLGSPQVLDSYSKFSIHIRDAKYPKDAIANNIQGIVSYTCIVEKDGSLSDIILKNSLCPSIDKEANRILSKIKLRPCQLEDKTFRYRQDITLDFKITRYRNNTGTNTTKSYNYDTSVYLNLTPSSAGKRHKGVAKRFVYSVTKEDERKQAQIKTLTNRVFIDIPENNQKLEQLICQKLFKEDSISLEETGKKIADKYRGVVNNQDFENQEYENLTISADVLGFKKDKYYSYACTTELYDESFSNYNVESKKTASHNFLFDIQDNRMLKMSDLLIPSCVEDICQKLGSTDINNLEIGMNDYFLYIGREDENIEAIGLCQENWDKFTPTLQDYLGNKSNLPISLNENDFEYTTEPNYIHELEEKEDGTTIIRTIEKGLKTRRKGVQPVGIIKGIIRKPNIGSNESLVHEYLTEIWKKNEIQPDSTGLIANISFVLNKDHTISNFQTKLKSGDKECYQKLKDLVSNFPKCKSMLFFIDGPAKNYFNYDVELGGKVYELVDKMPEYPGGLRAMFQWISHNIAIPDNVPAESLNSRIFVNCIIEEDGTVSNVKVMSTIDDSLKNEIESVLSQMPRWNPGQKDGKVVRVKTAFPLRLNLTR